MYTELHARSAFSFLEGASLPEELAGACAEQGMGAMALLDRDGVYGAPRFHLAAKKHSLKAHIGAEITSSAGWRCVLLVESRAGYQNLCRLITHIKLHAKKGQGRIAAEDLAGRAAGLICLTGGEEGPLAHALRLGGMEQATQCVQKLCHLLAVRMFTLNCSGISAARKKRAIRRHWGSRANYRCLCWPPTECAMPFPISAKFWTSLPAFATITI